MPHHTTLSCLSPAKLNLFLHITGRRPDGYHCLQTAFQLLDWGDAMQFTANSSGDITLSGCDLGIPDEENLIVRAARLLQGLYPEKSPGAAIIIDKTIPAGGGLGGGSSNAATTLLALNHLWGLRIDTKQLQSMGAELGADVPVFVAGYSAWAEGIGEILTPLALPKYWYLIIQPACHVSTAKIFSCEQLTRNTSPITLAAFFRGDSRNDCQPIVRSLYQEVDNALKWLGKFGEAKLTGTGACVFASFETKEAVDAVKRQLPKSWTGFVARGINKSPVLESLV
ncbi:MAG: 4-(cytidine 5'-diphospho)-2-C-methyl-D-erythritol kinase [Proteobacteria bacterium]|nr:4-(cytidine 5'-diphospho)-2-C-methyl-D-erythritol kinase [Pseudomonadota bacterium]